MNSRLNGRAVSPAARDIARLAVDRGLVVSELRGKSGVGMRRELLEAGGASSLSDAEWTEVAAVLLDATEKAARSSSAHSAGACRTCGQPVRWVRTTRGRQMPLDPLPTIAGNVRLRPSGSTVLAFVSGNQDLPLEQPAFRAHAATCPRMHRVPAPEKDSRPHCRVCGLVMDQQMYADGERTHPTCGEQQ